MVKGITSVIGLVLGVLLALSCDSHSTHERPEHLIGVEHKYTPIQEGENSFLLERDLSYEEIVEIMGRLPDSEDWKTPRECNLYYHHVCVRGRPKYIEIDLTNGAIYSVHFRDYAKANNCCADSLNVKKP